MALAATTLTLELHLSTQTGGPIVIGSGEVDVPLSTESIDQGVRVTIDQPVLRHEIVAALMDLARQLEHPDPGRI